MRFFLAYNVYMNLSVYCDCAGVFTYGINFKNFFQRLTFYVKCTRLSRVF